MLLKTYALSNINKYEQYLCEKELKEQTIRWYVKNVVDWISDSPEEIRKNDLIEYKERITKKYKLSTVNIKTIAINKFLVFLGHSDLKLNLEKRTYSTDLDNMITKEEYEILVNHALSTGRMKMYYLIRTLANTGIRASELRFVTVENVKKGKIRIINKRKERTIYFSKKLQDLIKEYSLDNDILTGYIFVGRDGCSLISNSTVNRNLKKIASECGLNLEKIHPHSFRHLFAKRFMEINGNLFELADILGHMSVETTRIYTKTTGEEKRSNLDMLDL